jgi:hypothetical protein
MADVTVTVDAKLNKAISATITPDGKIDGPAVWTKDSGGATMVVAPDGLSARFTWEGLSADETIEGHVDGDIDLDPGVVKNLTETFQIKLVFGGGGGGDVPATKLNVAFGTPEPNDPTLARSRRRY